MRKQWTRGWENNGQEDEKTMDKRMRKQWRRGWENNGQEDEKTMDKRMRKKWRRGWWNNGEEDEARQTIKRQEEREEGMRTSDYSQIKMMKLLWYQ